MHIIYMRFLLESLGYPVYTQKYMHIHVITSTDRDPLTFYFPIYSFYSLTALAKTLSAIFSKSSERGHPSRIYDLSGNAEFSP